VPNVKVDGIPTFRPPLSLLGLLWQSCSCTCTCL